MITAVDTNILLDVFLPDSGKVFWDPSLEVIAREVRGQEQI